MTPSTQFFLGEIKTFFDVRARQLSPGECLDLVTALHSYGCGVYRSIKEAAHRAEAAHAKEAKRAEATRLKEANRAEAKRVKEAKRAAKREANRQLDAAIYYAKVVHQQETAAHRKNKEKGECWHSFSLTDFIRDARSGLVNSFDEWYLQQRKNRPASNPQ